MALAGLGVAGYLTAVRASGGDPACVVGGGRSTVQDDEYAEPAVTPVAVLGPLAYGALLVAAVLPGPLGRALRPVRGRRRPDHAGVDPCGGPGPRRSDAGRNRSSVSTRPVSDSAVPRIEQMITSGPGALTSKKSRQAGRDSTTR